MFARGRQSARLPADVSALLIKEWVTVVSSEGQVALR